MISWECALPSRGLGKRSGKQEGGVGREAAREEEVMTSNAIFLSEPPLRGSNERSGASSHGRSRWKDNNLHDIVSTCYCHDAVDLLLRRAMEATNLGHEPCCSPVDPVQVSMDPLKRRPHLKHGLFLPSVEVCDRTLACLERPVMAVDMGKLRWGELDDDAEDLDFLLPPRVVVGPDENGVKKVIEYRFDDEGNKVRVTTTTRVRKLTRARLSKRALERRSWPKFGDAVQEDAGARLTMVSTEEILLERPRAPADGGWPITRQGAPYVVRGSFMSMASEHVSLSVALGEDDCETVVCQARSLLRISRGWSLVLDIRRELGHVAWD
ncbi:hypothetical protein GW17_00019300 [Ensete ventricosum]|nr:hypothetical protein GW17_00019300 [Ensete ventricosum]